MKITGKIVDGMNKEPLPSASIVVTDIFYVPQGPGTVADQDGNFELDSPALDNPSNLVIVSFVGYQERALSPQQAKGEIALSVSDAALQSVTVTAKKRIREIKVNNTWFYIALGVTISAWAGFTYSVIKK